jgi:hypothetical protein
MVARRSWAGVRYLRSQIAHQTVQFRRGEPGHLTDASAAGEDLTKETQPGDLGAGIEAVPASGTIG